MHTIIVIAGGLALLAIFVLAAHLSNSDRARAAFYLIPVWFVAALINMLVGIFRAGYSFAAEAPIFLVVFGVPAAVAWAIGKYAGR